MNIDKLEAELRDKAIKEHGEVVVNSTLADSGPQLERVRRLRMLLRIGEPERGYRLPQRVRQRQDRRQRVKPSSAAKAGGQSTP